jgi:Tfp pilus assembly protein PilZ
MPSQINEQTNGSNQLLGRRVLKKYNTNFARLLMMVLEMSEDQQRVLLKNAQQILEKRKRPRNPCLIPADYNVLNTSYRSFILDINNFGVYIETNGEFAAGQNIILSFDNPFSREKYKLSGEIVWSQPNAIGVKFGGLLERTPFGYV